MHDDRLEAALRDALRGEADAAGLSLDRTELHHRLAASEGGRTPLAWLVGAAAAVVLAAGLFTFILRPVGLPPVGSTPTPSAASTGIESPRPSGSAEPTQSEPAALFDPLMPTLTGEDGEDVAGWVGCYGHGTNSSGVEFSEQCGPSYEEPDVLGSTIGETVTLTVESPWGLTSWRIELLGVESVDAGHLPTEGRYLITSGESEDPTESVTFVLPEAEGPFVVIATVSLDGRDPQQVDTEFAFRVDMSDSGLAQNESRGAIDLWIDRPGPIRGTAPAVCRWSESWPAGTERPSGPRVATVETVQPFDIPREVSGETLSVRIEPFEPSPVRVERRPDLVDTGPAWALSTDPYAVHPGQPSIEATGPDDGSRGRLAYADVGMATGVRAGPPYPLNGDTRNETISLDVTWSCQPPDPSWAPEPTAAEPSSPPPLPPLEASLRRESGSVVVPSEAGCGAELTYADGTETADSCGSFFVGFAPPILDVGRTEPLLLEVAPGWQLTSWQATAYPAADVEAAARQLPETGLGIGGGDVRPLADGVELIGPAEIGRYWIVVPVDLDGEGPSAARISFVFRVDVAGQPSEAIYEGAAWDLAPGQAPGRDATSFVAWVTEQVCASGQSSDGRVSRPDVAYGADRVTVSFGVRRLPGGQDCQGNPPTSYVVELDEPLGDRALFDGGAERPRQVYPARP
jgi:hypothetical protein